jgi:hypothetical protein
MDALLTLSSAQSNYLCESVGDLQDQLRELLSNKVSLSKAQHISATFEFQSGVVFNVTTTEAESETHDNVHPSTASTTAVAGSRQITASDTLINQPQNDPALQKSVARHITTEIGAADQSSWMVRSVSRDLQGWAFTYQCKDSWGYWARQSSKNPAKICIGAWSGKDGQDPVNMSKVVSWSCNMLP